MGIFVGEYPRITCPTCDMPIVAGFEAMHRCMPAWLVGMEMEDADHSTIYARDAEDAACTWLMQQNAGSGEYHARPVRVQVQPAAGGRVEIYEVQMELTPSYFAYRCPT